MACGSSRAAPWPTLCATIVDSPERTRAASMGCAARAQCLPMASLSAPVSCLQSRPGANRYAPSRVWRLWNTVSSGCIRCSRHSSTTTGCSAVSARPGSSCSRSGSWSAIRTSATPSSSTCSRRICAVAPDTRTSSRQYTRQRRKCAACDSRWTQGLNSKMSGIERSDTPKFVGRSVPRVEDLPLVTGSGRYAASVSFPHQLHMRIVRSSYAHGRIIAIDTRKALGAPGCVAIWTAADVAGIPPIEFRPTHIKGLEPYRQRVLASERVRYVGEPVAAVFASDPYQAEDAAGMVSAEIEELPVLMSASQAPGEFEPGRDTEPAVIRKKYGDLEGAFRAAHAVVELDLSIGRHSGVPLETRGAIARYDAARDVLELHGATKRPHPNRDLIARMLGRSP